MKNTPRFLAVALIGLVARRPAFPATSPANSGPAHLWVLPADWIDHLPPTGSVNAPGRWEALSPSQKVALAMVSEGSEGDQAFDDCTLEVQLDAAGVTVEKRGLKPAAIRRIRAEGADAIVRSLDASGIGTKEHNQLLRETALVTFAVFQIDWSAPDVIKATTVKIRATLSGGSTPPPRSQTVELPLRPWADWANEPATAIGPVSAYLNRYHDNAQPGLLLPLFQAVVQQDGLQATAATQYFALVFEHNPTARAVALGTLPTLQPRIQQALLREFRLGGVKLPDSLPILAPDIRAAIMATEPLTDAAELPSLQDPLSLDAVRGIGDSMDRCWGAWMATGEQKYLRAIVNLLGGAEDFTEFAAWQKAKSGLAGLNGKVARGLAYQIAGWSLGSFARSDPHVSDWLIYWQNDPTMAPELRKQIASLSTNPAFRRK